MGGIKRVLAIIDDSPSLVPPEMQVLGIERALNGLSRSEVEFIHIVFDELTDKRALFQVFASKKPTHVVCYRLATMRELANNFWETCQLIAEIKNFNIEFHSIQEKINTEDELGQFLAAITSGWQVSRAKFKSENAKISQIKAKMKGTHLGRPKIRDDQQIKILRTQGLSIRSIAAKLRISPAAVQTSLRAQDKET